ncbi:RNA polymerase sigma factor [Methylovulum miyakonense]|uniref:RNA polymerase sigma factor n=1 Tax=Methylovulum miyakonense TaxID=645578 RepID=UPI0003722B59|nr:RNA polymerase sigma factor [Methylovulum miyakonense]
MNIEKLYQNHQHELIDFSARIVSNREVAEDITQESFIIFFREKKQQHIENPRGFLYQVAKNLAFDHLKHNKVINNYMQTQQLSSDYGGLSPSVEQLIADGQYVEMIKQVIDELPPRCRETFLLNKFHEMNYAEIAKFTGISESGVEKHMMKGLRHCRKKIPEFLPKKSRVRPYQASTV